MTVGPIRLVEGRHRDLDAVAEVMADSFDRRYGEAWTAAQCAGLLPMPGVWLSLARDETRLVGFALARIVAGEAELLLLAVRSTAQSQGVGKMLLHAFSAEAKTRGANRLHLEVREGNHAVKLYEQAGFVTVGRRRNYYQGDQGHRSDALTLAKDIDRRD